MFDIKLVDGDIQQSNSTVRDLELILQKIQIRLKTWMGEWILDRSVGMQYERLFMQKPPRLTEFTSLVRREIEDVEGVTAVIIEESVFEPETKTIRISGRVQAEDEEAAIQARVGTDLYSFEFLGV